MTDSVAAEVSLQDQVKCVRREIAFRQHVYPRMVADARMSQAKADHELLVMRAVLATLQRLVDAADGLRAALSEDELRTLLRALQGEQP